MSIGNRDGLKWTSIIISIVALSISLGGFYFQFVREVHSVKATVTTLNLDDWASKKTTASVNGVLVNAGNMHEVVYSAGLRMEGEGVAAFSIDASGGPFVLKPGEAMPFTLTSGDNLGATFDMVGNWDTNQEGELEVYVEFDAVWPDGTSRKTKHQVGVLRYLENSENYRFEGNTESERKWSEIVR